MKRPLQVFNYSIKNQANGEVDIHIDGEIVDASTQAIWRAYFGDDTSVSFKSFRDQLNAVQAQTYNVYINSPGGIVTDAMAIHDLLKDMQAKGKTVNTRGRGIVSSSATYILMAGNNAEMSQNSWFMIHNVGGSVWGDVNEVERYARTLRTFNDASRDFYASVTNMRKEEITKMMNEETWMTANTAKEKGFIKQITGEAEFTQAISKDEWPFSNMVVLNSYNSAVKPATEKPDLINQKLDDMKNFFQDLGTSIMNAIKGIKAPENNDHGSLMNSIGEAVNKSFSESAEQLEVSVTDVVNKTIASKPVNDAISLQVTNAVTSAVDFSKDGPGKTALDAAVKVAVENATKDYGAKITALETAKTELEQKNKDLETEITNMKGNKSTPNKDEDDKTPKVTGKWS